MKSRSQYRPQYYCDNKTVINAQNSEPNITRKTLIKRKSPEVSMNCLKTNKAKRVDPIECFTIEDSDDDQVIASKESSNQIKSCIKCAQSMKTIIDYNSLTSADFYLNPRAHPEVIAAELRDQNRYKTYQMAINDNKHLFKDKVVLNVGSGVGLLALFAAKAGAKTVVVIDSKEMIGLIETIFAFNRNKHDSDIIVMRGQIEDMVLPNGIQKVDILLSDWMNLSIFYKSMLKIFIYSRDKWLAKDGLIVPDSANMYISGGHDGIHNHCRRSLKYSRSSYIKRIEWWDSDIYGFDMKATREEVLKVPLHESVKESQVITTEFLLKNYDFYAITLDDINFTSTFELKARKDHYLQMFVTYFEVIFTKNLTIPRMFSSRPGAPKTRFKPFLLFINNEKELTLYKNNIIKGSLTFTLNKEFSQFWFDIGVQFKNNVCQLEEQLAFNFS